MEARHKGKTGCGTTDGIPDNTETKTNQLEWFFFFAFETESNFFACELRFIF